MGRSAHATFPLLVALAACTQPRAVADLGPDPSLGPHIASLQEERDRAVQVDVGLARAASPRYCPVRPSVPLVPPLHAPSERYLLVIATERPLSIAELQGRLGDMDLSAEGRELLTEVAVQAVGPDARWAAYAAPR